MTSSSETSPVQHKDPSGFRVSSSSMRTFAFEGSGSGSEKVSLRVPKWLPTRGFTCLRVPSNEVRRLLDVRDFFILPTR